MMHSTKSGKKPLLKWQFEALGTTWSIETLSELVANVRTEIEARIEVYDKTYSRFRNDSLVRKLRTPGEYEFPQDVTALLSVYKKMYHITNGQMTPLIGAMLEDAGYDVSYSLKPKIIQDIPPFEALGWDGIVKVMPTEPVTLDVGAAGKGYLVDIVSEILERHAISEYIIDASGDIKQRGEPKIIGLEHPLDTTKIIGTAKLCNQSLCASAINRRSWHGLHHVFNPHTKKPTNTMLATWVVAATTKNADALATALFFVPAADLLKDFNFAYVTIDMNGVIDVSPNFDGELFI